MTFNPIDMMRWTFINRILYSLLSLSLCASLVIAFMPVKNSENSTTLKPVNVTHINIPKEPTTMQLTQPARNIFDPNGKIWQAKTQHHPQQQNKPHKVINVLGIVRLPGLEGLLTSAGFYKIGQRLNGGKLIRVADGGYVLEFPDEQKFFAIDSSRERRRKRFKSIGFPFLNND